jgi:MinD superfamily P-loop ATPase
MKIAIASGKGGTGKTSMVASLASLAKEAVLADCDVDAADLHLVLPPSLIERHQFRSGHLAVIREEACRFCGHCIQLCRFGAIVPVDDGSRFQVDPLACEGCGVCVEFCPPARPSISKRGYAGSGISQKPPSVRWSTPVWEWRRPIQVGS